MSFSNFWSWLGGDQPERRNGSESKAKQRIRPTLARLENRDVPNGYIAVGAGAGAMPLVTIRVDKTSINGAPPNNAGEPSAPVSDGRTDYTTQTFLAYAKGFTGGVTVTTGNFDGDYTTPDFLVTGVLGGGGPHVKVWRMVDDGFGNVTVGGLFCEFMAYSPSFTGGLNLATGDLDGDGRAELIIGAGKGGGPHVKIYKFDISDRKAVLSREFMAYEPSFRGGVSVSSGQGYQTPLVVRQALDAPHPDNFYGPSFVDPIGGVPNNAYAPYGAIRPGSQTVPDGAGGFTPIPLAGTDPFTGNGWLTVASGVIQYCGGNMLNNFGNLAYEPNVVDLPNHDIPPEMPLVYGSWTQDSTTRPPWARPDVVYGPMVQVQPPIDNNPAIVTPMWAPAGQVNSRNQLVTGPGVGGGPVVRVWDFVAGANATINQNAMIEFLAFDPNFRGGINVSIGSFVKIPNANPFAPIVVPDISGLDIANVTFPYDTGVYRQYSAQICVTTASGGARSVVFSDYKPDPATRRTSITELNMVGTVLNTITVYDPTSPLTGFQSTQDVTYFDNAIDPQFRGQILTTMSALRFDGTAATASAQNVFAAGASSTPPSRGTQVNIYNNLGPLNAAGGQASHTPDDSFQAFLTGVFPQGVGGVAFGFSTLPVPTIDVLDLTAIGVPSIVTDGQFLPPQ